MKSIQITGSRNKLCMLVDGVNKGHEPIQIWCESGSAILISEEHWNAIQDILHLVSTMGMKDSNIEGTRAPSIDE